MNKPAARIVPSKPAEATGVMQRLRRRGIMAVLLLSLVCAAPRPAHAVAGIDDVVVNLVAGLRLTAGWARSMAESVGITTMAYIHTIMEAFRARGQFDQARATEAYRNEVTKRSLQAQLEVESMTPPNNSTCIGTTAALRERESAAGAAAGASELTNRDMELMLGNRGSASPAGGGGAVGDGAPGGSPPSGPPAGPRDQINGRPNGNTAASSLVESFWSCRYVNPADVAQKRRCERINAPEIGVLAGLNTRTSTLLDAAAFDNQLHLQVAKDICKNLTVNTEFEIASQRTAMRSTSAITANRNSYAEAALASFTQYICNEAVAMRTPENSDYGYNNSDTNQYNTLYRTALGPFGWNELTEGQLGTWPPEPEGDAEVAPASYSSGSYYVPGRAPSPMQRQLIEMNTSLSQNIVLGSAVGVEVPMRQMIITKATTLKQNFYRYKQLERSLLMEAMQLARQVRKGAGGRS